MKPAKALAAIQEVLYYRINGCTTCPDYIAEAVLSSLEELGMFTPTILIPEQLKDINE